MNPSSLAAKISRLQRSQKAEVDTSGWRPSPDRSRDLSDSGDVLFWIGDFRVVLSPIQSARALRLHGALRGRHALHRLCARPARARTGAQQRPWREVHRGPASGAAGVSGSVPFCGEGSGTRVCVEATYSRAEARVDRQRSEEHTSELQSLAYLVCRLLLEKKKNTEVDHVPEL